MSAELAMSLALIAFGAMWACWKIGFEAGQNEVIDKLQDYYRKQRKQEENE